MIFWEAVLRIVLEMFSGKGEEKQKVSFAFNIILKRNKKIFMKKLKRFKIIKTIKISMINFLKLSFNFKILISKKVSLVLFFDHFSKLYFLNLFFLEFFVQNFCLKFIYLKKEF